MMLVALALIGTAFGFPSPAYLDLEETLFLQQDGNEALKDGLTKIKEDSEGIANVARDVVNQYGGVKASEAAKSEAVDVAVKANIDAAAAEQKSLDAQIISIEGEAKKAEAKNAAELENAKAETKKNVDTAE